MTRLPGRDRPPVGPEAEPTPLLAAFAPFLESGLHADTQTFTLDGGAGTPTETGTGTGTEAGQGLVTGFSSLFTR